MVNFLLNIFFTKILFSIIWNFSISGNKNSFKYCLDKLGVKRSINDTWNYKGCKCKCLYFQKASKINCQNCSKLNNSRIEFTITPLNVSVYYFNRAIEIKCTNFTIDTIPYLFLNSSELFIHNERSMEIGGKYNKSNKTICGFCYTESYQSSIQCYTMNDENIKIQIKPEGDTIYFIYPNLLQCIFHSKNVNSQFISFDLYGLKPHYYQNVTSLSKSLFNNISNYPNQICLVCGDAKLFNVSKCYYITDKKVSIEILPPIDYYLTNENKRYIWCTINPRNALQQFPSLKFLVISLPFYKKINQTHIQVCNPKNRCDSDLCVICSASRLENTVKCYKKYSGSVQVSITPNIKFLLYMLPHEIKCNFEPHFLLKDEIIFNLQGLKTGIDFKKEMNLIIRIFPDINLDKKIVCIYCGFFYANKYTSRCYNLTANISFEYNPKFPIYLVKYRNYSIKAFYIWSKIEYNASCKIIQQSYVFHQFDNKILLNVKVPTGKYQFNCYLLNTSNYFTIKLNIYNGYVRISFLPNNTALDFMYYSEIFFNYEPELAQEKVIITVFGINKDQYELRNNKIVIKRNIYLIGSKACINLFYPFVFNLTKCYNLTANVTFHYTPIFKYYCVYYQSEVVHTFFKHSVLSENFESECKFFKGNIYPKYIDGGIFLSNYLTTGNYVFQCYMKSSNFYQFLSLEIYDGPIGINIYPNNDKFIITTDFPIFCLLTPNYLILSYLNLKSINSNFQRVKPNELMGINSLVFHKKCICFHCESQFSLETEHCINFETELQLHFKPNQNIFFAWSNLTVKVYFSDINKPNQSYSTTCYDYNRNSRIKYVEGEIIFSKLVFSGSYKIYCNLKALNLEYSRIINVYAQLVSLNIEPNDIDMYSVHSETEIVCNVYPLDLLDLIVDIRFINVNSTQFRNISNRKIIIGMNDSEPFDTICVVCGHEFLPINATKCLIPYDGKINVTILPMKPDLFINNFPDILCLYEPYLFNSSRVYFKIFGIKSEDYIRIKEIGIRIKNDKTLVNRNICVVCGNLPSMNGSICYTLKERDRSKVSKYVLIGVVVSIGISVTLYIYFVEIM